MPDLDPRTEVGRLGRSLNRMLAQIESSFQARTRSEAAARRSEERMRQFVADASHELRTPLTAMRGYAEYYRQRGGVRDDAADAAAARPARGAGQTAEPASQTAGPGATAAVAPLNGTGQLNGADLDRIMQRVEQESARMGVLVEDMLLLARLDQQRPLERRPVDLLTLAADAVQDARIIAPDRAIDLNVGSATAFLVLGDEVRLRQVIGNLMSNALSHTPDGTPVTVAILAGPREPVPSVVLEVTDQGPGMPPEQAEHVFERFYRGDQARTRKAGGTGLGLAIVAALVAAHGGTVALRTAPGQGATFRVTLPLAPEAQRDEPTDDDETPARGTCRPGPPRDYRRNRRSPIAAPRRAAPSAAANQSRTQRGAGGAADGSGVAAAEQAGVHQQRVQLVQRDPVPPARGQRRHVGVRAQDPVQVRRAEQVQHGQVGLPVTALRGRVDQPAPAARPQHVAGPAVAMNPAGRLGRPGQAGQPVHHLLHQPGVRGGQRAGVGRPAEVGQQPLAAVPASPVTGPAQRARHRRARPRCGHPAARWR